MGSELSLFGARLAKEAQELEGTSIESFWKRFEKGDINRG
jgi:hypothetical protein